MARHHLAPVFLVTFIALAWTAGCGQNPAAPGAGSGEDRAQILRAVAAAPELAMDFSDDDGELLGTATPAAPTGTTGTVLAPADTILTATTPIHWGRRRIPRDRPPQRIVEFVLPPDSGRAIVRVTVRFDGWFFVDTTDDSLRNPGKKPLRDEAVCTALFRKIWFHPDSTARDSVFGWRLVALSPVHFHMTDPSRQTVEIRSVSVITPSGTTTISDPSAPLALRGTGATVPITKPGETVRVEAAITNTDHAYRPSEFVYIHVPINTRPFPGPFDRVRIRMHDDGTEGDRAANDGIYTVQWTVQDVGRHHVAVDVLNARTLQNETQDDYNATTWGVPYASYPAL